MNKVKKIALIALLVSVIIESCIIIWGIYEYSQGFFIDHYFNQKNGDTKVSYYIGNIKLWDEMRRSSENTDKNDWLHIHRGGTINTIGGEKPYVYWQRMELLRFFLSQNEFYDMRREYLKKLNQNPEDAYAYVDKIIEEYRKLAFKIWKMSRDSKPPLKSENSEPLHSPAIGR